MLRQQRRSSPRAAALGACSVLLAALLLCAQRAAAAADLYSEDGDVHLIEGGKDAFKEAILSSHGAAVVEFFTPSCPHCVALAPEYKKVAANLKGIATVAAVDCSRPDSRRLCESYAVRGYPSLRLFAPDLKPNPYTGEAMKDVEEYKGSSSARDIAAAVTDLLHDRHIAAISSDADLDAFAPSLAADAAGKGADAAGKEGAAGKEDDKAAALARVLLFTDKPKTTVLYKALSTAFAGRLMFGQAHKGAGGAAAARLGVEEFPTLVVVKPDGKTETYTGALKAAPLRAFLDAFAADAPVGAAAAGAKGGAGGAQGGAKTAQEEILKKIFEVPVERLSPGNLTALDEDKAMWLLGVHGGAGEADCKDAVAAFDAAAQAAQAVVKFGTLSIHGADPGARGALKAMGLDLGGLDAEPCALQAVLLPYGPGKADQDAYKRWEGGLDDAKALQSWILEEVPDSTVVLTNEQALSMFMQAPPEAGKLYGKVVLLASKEEVPGIYKALAMAAQDRGMRFAFGWVPSGPATKAFVEKARPMLRLDRVPGLVAAVPYSGPDTPKSPPGSVPMAMEPFRGSLKFQMMLAWLRQLGAVLGLSDGDPLIPGMGGAPAPAGAAAVAEVASQQQLQQACYGKGALCLLGLLDGAADDAGEQAKLFDEAAQQAAAAQQPGVVSFARLDASAQRSLREALGLRRDQLPALAVVSAKRLRFALAPPGARFGPGAAKELLDGVLRGKLATAPLAELPRYVDGGDEDAAAGAGADEDADAAAVEDEFDLSEIMAEGGIHLPTKEEQLRQAEEELRREAEERAKAAAAEKARAAKSKGKSKKSKKKKKAPAKDAAKDEL